MQVDSGSKILTLVTTQKWKCPVFDDTGCTRPAYFSPGLQRYVRVLKKKLNLRD
jgi:hypothetical protein